MSVCLATTAALFAVYSVDRPDGIGGTREARMELSGAPARGVIACSYIFVATFACTWGPVSWVYPSELFPLRYRSKAVAFSTSCNWAFNTALALAVPIGFVTIKWKVYVIFSVFCAVMAVHVFFLFPETARKPLDRVTDIFEAEGPGTIRRIGVPAWRTGWPAPRVDNYPSPAPPNQLGERWEQGQQGQQDQQDQHDQNDQQDQQGMGPEMRQREKGKEVQPIPPDEQDHHHHQE